MIYWILAIVGRWTARKPYQVNVYDRAGPYATYACHDFDEALRTAAELARISPSKIIKITNLDHAEAEWDGERTIVHDGLTKEEREALNK